MAYGVTVNGFEPKPLSVIKSELEASLAAVFGATFDTQAESVNGQIIGIFADRIADVWQLGQAVYNAAFPDSASGVSLDLILALTATSRIPATFSKVVAQVIGTPGASVPALIHAQVAPNGPKFTAVGTGVLAGDLWPDALGHNFTFVADETGPNLAPSGTLTILISGGTAVSISNALDQYIIGNLIESDAATRLRRELTLRAIGSASAQAVKARLADVANVTDVIVFENETDTTDAHGLPPHSIEAVVLGGLAASLTQALYDAKAMGVGTYGNTAGDATGADGISRVVFFSIPADVNVYHDVAVTVDPAKFPNNGTDQIKAAIVAYGVLRNTIGRNAIASAVIPEIFKVPGVLDVTHVGLGTSPPSPGGGTASITITNRQRAAYDTGRIAIVVS